jgi:hypothetical protein
MPEFLRTWFQRVTERALEEAGYHADERNRSRKKPLKRPLITLEDLAFGLSQVNMEGVAEGVLRDINKEKKP